MLKKRIFTPYILCLFAFFMALGLFMFWSPKAALAQDPSGCVGNQFLTDVEGWHLRPDLNDFAFGPLPQADDPVLSWSSEFGGSLFAGQSTQSGKAMAFSSGELNITLSETSTLEFQLTNTPVSVVVRLRFDDDSTADVYVVGTENSGTRTQNLDVGEHAGKTVIAIEVQVGSGGTIATTWSYFCFDNVTTGADVCPLVENAHFAAEEGWLLDGGATITNSILSLPVGGIAAQNLTLQSETLYNAVISTTSTLSDSTSLSVVLGTISQTLEITTSGRFTLAFSTPVISGTIIYGLENIGENSIDLDFTCVYTATGDGQVECIAPINGTFETADNWSYQRGAHWDAPSKKAALPFADVALIYSTSVYTFPTITGTEHLLLSFTSRKMTAETAAIMGRIYDGIDSINWLFETHTTEYIFETSLDTMAGNDNAEIAFVNPGLTGSAEISSTADVTLDNVCIFVANRGPNLPTPQDPDGIDPIDLGFNFTSCADVDGFFAYFGINIAQYRADYQAGASVWDPIGWVPWLVAAFWTILASWVCFFMAAFAFLIAVLEYILNNLLNIASWAIRTFPGFVGWLQGWLNFIGVSLANLSSAYGVFLASWSSWIGVSLANLSAWIGQSLANLSDGLAQFLANWSEWIGISLANLSAWIGTTLANWSEWIGVTLANLSTWIGTTLADAYSWLSAYLTVLNGLRFIVAVLISAWNPIWGAVGGTISLILDLLVLLWNLLVPFFESIWSYFSPDPAMSLGEQTASLLLAIWNMFWTVLRWVWANIFQVIYIPINFYYAFDDGVHQEAFAYLLDCADLNFWCSFLAGIELVNRTSAHTVVYPVVIVGIIVGTIIIFWRYIWALFHIEIS